MVTLVKDEFEVEFLAKQIGKPIPVVDSLNFGKLENLGHMSVIEKNIITVGYEGVPVSIPNPAAFALQKMVINKDRKAKQMKDAEAVKNLVYALERDAGTIRDFHDIYSTLTVREIRSVKAFCNKYSLDLTNLVRD